MTLHPIQYRSEVGISGSTIMRWLCWELTGAEFTPVLMWLFLSVILMKASIITLLLEPIGYMPPATGRTSVL